jgi:anti-anti-sigma factor
MSLSIEIRETTVVKLKGRLDSMTSPAAEEQLQALVERAPRHVVLDLAGLEFLTSAGLRVLFLLKKGLDGKGTESYMLNPQPQVARVLEIAKALPSLRIFKSSAELDEYLAGIQAKVVEGGE